MKTTHELHVFAICPADPSVRDVYATTVEVDGLIPVEDILAAAAPRTTLRCKDYPDVLVSDAEALEVALHEVLDDDEAVDSVMVVLREGWRPKKQLLVGKHPKRPGEATAALHD